MKAKLLEDGPDGRAEAVSVLRGGGIVALPTDTVYGVAVDMAAPGGIERLFAAKRRPPGRGIVLLLADAAQSTSLGRLSPAGEALGAAFWPGGLTLVLRQLPDVRLPQALTGGASTIGLRVPDHPAPRALAAALGPLPTTSANLSGEPDALTAREVLSALGDTIDLVLDGGPAPGGRASTVVDLTGARPSIARSGAIPDERIREVLEAVGIQLRPPDGPTSAA